MKHRNRKSSYFGFILGGWCAILLASLLCIWKLKSAGLLNILSPTDHGADVTTVATLPPDITPPVVTASDFTITVGDAVSYKQHVTFRDDRDEAPVLEIDNSAVDAEKPGQYPVIYSVTDSAGNQTVSQIVLTVKDKVYNFKEDADGYLRNKAQAILDKILTDDMNDMQKAYAIYRWTKRNIGYSGTSNKSDYKIGARDGFVNRSGDCFTYFAVSKVLLTQAGIENVDIVKLRTSKKQSRHYWSLINIGTGWYHFDCTQFSKSKANFFMVTDKELKAWDAKYYPNAHRYDPDGLPKQATKSVQHLIQYGSSKLNVSVEDYTNLSESTTDDDAADDSTTTTTTTKKTSKKTTTTTKKTTTTTTEKTEISVTSKATQATDPGSSSESPSSDEAVG